MRTPISSSAPETVNGAPETVSLEANRDRTEKARKALARKRANQAKDYTRRGLAAYQSAADPSSTVGQLLASYRDALTADAGGPDTLSSARAMLVETTCVSLVLCRALDGWLLARLTNPELDPATLPVMADR